MAEKEAAMKAAKAGELALLKNHLEGLDVPAYADLEDGLNQNHLIIAAAENGHMEVIDWLLNERFPDYTPHLHSHLAAIQGGPKVYDVFITKWPYLLEMELSHSGNPLGLSILGNRKDLVKFILEKGVDPNTAEFNHHSYFESEFLWRRLQQEQEDILALLIEYGLNVPKGMKGSSSRHVRSHCTVL